MLFSEACSVIITNSHLKHLRRICFKVVPKTCRKIFPVNHLLELHYFDQSKLDFSVAYEFWIYNFITDK